MSSLARATALARPRTATAVLAGPSALAQRRFASTHHDDHHHEEHASNDIYPDEGFNSVLWMYAAVGTVATGLWYRYGPSQGEGVALTRLLSAGATKPERWIEIVASNAALVGEAADRTKILHSARPAQIIRFKYPQSLTQFSHQKEPLAPGVDISHVRPKTDKEQW